MPKGRINETAVALSWWLSDGDEECPHCGGWYFYEVEFRCAECDGPGCPHCQLVHAEGYRICPACMPAGKKVSRG